MSRMVTGSGVLICLLVMTACASRAPRIIDLPEPEPQDEAPPVQKEDLAGELLVTPPRSRGERIIAENPLAVLSLVGMAEVPPVVLPDTIPPMPDIYGVSGFIEEAGPRKEYQIQVAVTPSADEAEELKERLSGLIPGEEVFIIFKSPYYRIRVGKKRERAKADRLFARLQELGYTGAIMIPVTISPGGGVH